MSTELKGYKFHPATSYLRLLPQPHPSILFWCPALIKIKWSAYMKMRSRTWKNAHRDLLGRHRRLRAHQLEANLYVHCLEASVDLLPTPSSNIIPRSCIIYCSAHWVFRTPASALSCSTATIEFFLAAAGGVPMSRPYCVNICMQPRRH